MTKPVRKKPSFRARMRKLMMYFLPKSVRARLFRKMILLKAEPPEGFIFKIAETEDELTQAFALLHDSYVSMRLMDPHPSGMRITKYHALPSTTTLIAVKDGKVAATVSLVRSNPFGLPCEKLYDIDFLKIKRARIAEVSALAISPKYSGSNGELLWPMLKFMYEYSTRYFGLDYYVMVVHPEWFEFYDSILFFKKFSKKKVSRYDFVNGAPAQGGFLNLRHFHFHSEFAYGRNDENKNLFRYMTELSFETFHFPKRKYASVSDPVMTPKLFDHFFNKVTDGFDAFTEIERSYLASLYKTDEFRKVLPITGPMTNLELERSLRFDVDCRAQLLTSPTNYLEVLIKSASKTGVGAIMHRKIRFNTEYEIEIQIGRFDVANLAVVPVWLNEDGSCGFAILKSSSNWNLFIENLERDLTKAG